MSVQIFSLSEAPDLWQNIIPIFFESSARSEFESVEAKNDFLYKYLGYYRENYPDYFLVGVLEKEVMGYICGSPDSSKDLVLFDILPHYGLFKDLYSTYPAHLHINLSENSRGKGIGSKLIRQFENLCQSPTHLITSPSARNRSFYLKNDYSFESVRSYSNTDILFMGKSK
jgi:GNAT superfamily N-acetyltransferase